MNHTQTTRPQSATEILRTASSVLGERGKQYDPNGKQERSMTAICAAFNAIYPASQLTVHMGWQFMSLVKMVRGATKPHADSALDQVAYAALAAEEVAQQLHQPAQLANPCELGMAAQVATEPSYKSLQVSNQALAGELGKCQQWAKHLTAKFEDERKANEAMHIEVTRLRGKLQDTYNEAEVDRLKAIIATQDARLHNLQLAHKAQVIELVAELDTTHAALSDFVCRFDLTKEYMTKEQVLAGQAKHEAQVEKLRERECLDIETINDLRTELASCKAMIDRLYSEKQGAERELEQVRCTNFNRSADLTTLEQVHQAALKELETVRGECISRGAQLAEARARLQRVAEPAIAHNTDEPKAPRPEYVDPYDQYGDTQPLASKPRIVGDADPARGGLAYPNGKPL